ncbi:MAG: peptidylprolyl isomerase [Acidobacteria bacterium]|nr:peptidylprolyl isomerase [Acidobacteriota bacterium]
MTLGIGLAVLVTSVALPLQGGTQPSPVFVADVPIDELRGKQAVVETTLGTIVIDLLADAAPNHVAYVIKLARDGTYAGTTFHRMIKYGIVQGGDPLSKDPARHALYGTGGLGVLRAEPNAEKHTRGAVSEVTVPGRPDSAGAQFFICVSDQPALDGQYTVFGRVAEGLDIVRKISETPVDADGRAIERVEIRSVTIRDKPPPEPEPFTAETPEQLDAYRAVLETSMGEITVEFAATKAPMHVRNFLRLAKLGVYDGTAFHRVVPGFVIQTGSLTTRREALTERQQRVVRTLQPEFNDTPHVKGIVSMARGDDPASASTSFFICTGPAAALDGKYTAFGRVVRGMEVVEAIEAAPVDGEAPRTRIELTRIRIETR